MKLRDCLSKTKLNNENLEKMRQAMLNDKAGKIVEYRLTIFNDELFIEENGELYPYDLLYWQDLIEAEVDDKCISEYGIDKVVAFVLDELSNYGQTHDENIMAVEMMNKKLEMFYELYALR